jgi:hypothetical protein
MPLRIKNMDPNVDWSTLNGVVPAIDAAVAAIPASPPQVVNATWNYTITGAELGGDVLGTVDHALIPTAVAALLSTVDPAPGVTKLATTNVGSPGSAVEFTLDTGVDVYTFGLQIVAGQVEVVYVSGTLSGGDMFEANILVSA